MGNADALFELFIYYANGIGVDRNEQLAIELCEAAAEKGQSRAMYNLGAFHVVGRFVPKDSAKAVLWYQRAADAGNPQAMVGLAALYATGDGVTANKDYARQLLDEAEHLGMEVDHVRESLGV